MDTDTKPLGALASSSSSSSSSAGIAGGIGVHRGLSRSGGVELVRKYGPPPVETVTAIRREADGTFEVENYADLVLLRLDTGDSGISHQDGTANNNHDHNNHDDDDDDYDDDTKDLICQTEELVEVMPSTIRACSDQAAAQRAGQRVMAVAHRWWRSKTFNIPSLYFFLGILLMLPDFAISIYLRDSLLLSPAAVQSLWGFMFLPYLLKPVYGLITDTFPINGYRRKPYLLGCSLLCGFTWIAMGLYGWATDGFHIRVHMPEGGATAFDVLTDDADKDISQLVKISRVVQISGLLLESFFTCFAGVVVDSLVVERYQVREREELSNKPAGSEAGHLQTDCSIARICGTVIVGFFAGQLLDWLSPPTIFFITSIPAFIIFAVAFFFIDEQPLGSSPRNLLLQRSIEMDNLSTVSPSPQEIVDLSPTQTQTQSNSDPLISKDTGPPACLSESVSVPLIEDETQESQSTSTSSSSSLLTESMYNPKSLSGVIKESLAKVGSQIQLLKRAFIDERLWKPAMFLLLITSSPSSFSPFFYYLIGPLQFTGTTLGLMNVATNIATLIGAICYKVFFLKLQLRVVFCVTIITGAILRSSQMILISGLNRQLGIPDPIFAIGDSAVLSVMSELALMPIIILGAKVCPPGVEGSLYSLLMTVVAVGGFVSDMLGSTLTSILGVTSSDFSNLWLLILICNISTLVPLLIIFLVPRNLRQVS